MKYPKEWLGFRVRHGGEFARRGAIVEVIGPWSVFDAVGAEWAVPLFHLAVRIVDGATGAETGARAVLGYEGCNVRAIDVKPLTAAARDLLCEVLA